MHSDAHLANTKEFLLLIKVVHRNFGATCMKLFFRSKMLWKLTANCCKGLCRARPVSAVPEWLEGWFVQMEGLLFVWDFCFCCCCFLVGLFTITRNVFPAGCLFSVKRLSSSFLPFFFPQDRLVGCFSSEPYGLVTGSPFGVLHMSSSISDVHYWVASLK